MALSRLCRDFPRPDCSLGGVPEKNGQKGGGGFLPKRNTWAGEVRGGDPFPFLWFSKTPVTLTKVPRELLGESLNCPSKNGSAFRLGPPVERLEYGYPFFPIVYFSGGTLPEVKGQQSEGQATSARASINFAGILTLYT